LVDLLVPPEDKEELKDHASRLPSIQLSDRAVCDLELLATGGFSPLQGFMGQEDHARVLGEMRLTDGHLSPLPVTLPVAPEDVHLDQEVALREASNRLLAVLAIEEAYEWDRREVSRRVFGTEDTGHPMVAEMARWGPVNLAGRLRVLDLPRHFDFRDLRLTPAQCAARLSQFGARNVVAFQTRNPMHRVHEELTKRAAAAVDGVLLLHPVVGLTKPGDVDHYTRVRTYRALAGQYYPAIGIVLALLPLAMRMGGPREALWHAIIRRNYGANHLIVGRDHAGPGNDSSGKPFYGPYDAQELVEQYSEEVGVKVVPFNELVYLPKEGRYEETSRVAPGAVTASISGTEVRRDYLEKGVRLPDWFTRPEVAEVLAESYPPRHKQGACVWFTGLSGSGKSVTAEILAELLREQGRHVTVLDGDAIRAQLSKELGCSKEDRDTNVLRIGFVASEIVRAGGVALCAAVSPYAAARDSVRRLIGDDRFLEVFVNTPIEVCEARDTKGLYAKARRGEIKAFTGIDGPYEAPTNPDLELETCIRTAEENAGVVLEELRSRGFVKDSQAP
jgi:sulfate adenylyltransferase